MTPQLLLEDEQYNTSRPEEPQLLKDEQYNASRR
jgi:hypothetical protein